MKKIDKYFIAVLLVIQIIMFAYVVNAGSTGSVSPSKTGVTKNEWTNPTNAYSQNDQYGRGGNTADEQDYYGFDFEFDNFNSIIGITVSIDGYGGKSGCYYVVKLSWNGGASWTSTKNSASIGTSDTDTYVDVGGSSDTWGRSWTSESELSEDNFVVYLQVYHLVAPFTVYTDHVYVNIFYKGYPSEVTNFYTVTESCSKNINLTWICPTYNFADGVDKIRIQRKTTGFPSSIGDGTNILNGTGTLYSVPTGIYYYVDTSTSYDTLYYYCAWAFNDTYNLWSTSPAKNKVRTPCECEECNSTDLTVHNNTEHTTGKYETKYDSSTGWEIWLNYTGELPQIKLFDNIVNATGTHEYQSLEDGYLFNVYANYTGNTTPVDGYDENIYFATGNLEYILTSDGYYIWANYTGITTPIMNYYENLINCTGTLEYNLITDGISERYWNLYANYTGNCTGGDGCNKIVLFNFSDENITIWGFVNCSTETNDTNYTINDDNWLWLSGFQLEAGELGIFILFLIFSLSFWVDKDEKHILWQPILLLLDVPIALATGIYYIGNTTFSIEWWVGITLFLFAILLSIAGIYYALQFGRKK